MIKCYKGFTVSEIADTGNEHSEDDAEAPIQTTEATEGNALAVDETTEDENVVTSGKIIANTNTSLVY